MSKQAVRGYYEQWFYKMKLNERNINGFSSYQMQEFAEQYHQDTLKEIMPSDEEIDEMTLKQSENLAKGSFKNGIEVGFSRGMITLKQKLLK